MLLRIRRHNTLTMQNGWKWKELFSFAKRCYGLGGIKTKLDSITKSSIALSILIMDVTHIVALSLRQFLIMLFSGFRHHENMLKLYRTRVI